MSTTFQTPFKLFTLSLLVTLALPAFGQKAKNLRMVRNEDGTHSQMKLSDDQRTITRQVYGKEKNGNGEKKLRMTVVYRKDPQGRLRNGTVYSGKGKVLYRVKYGYHRITGQLVKEHMFDAQVKRTKVVTGADGQPKEVEYAVRKLDYRYDAQGRQMKPICVCLPAGKTAEELFGKGKSSHIKDPWAK